MKSLLMTPGPTPVPESISERIAQPIIHHRTQEYRDIFKEVIEDLKTIFRTKNDCLVFASSGTGAMEASVVNLLSPGDKAVVIRGGKFGERYFEICKAFGIDVIPIDIEWGTSPDVHLVEEVLKRNTGVKALYTQLCETSTATVYDIESIGEFLKDKNIVFVVDAISGLGADNLETDSWGVDVAVSGSQKGLMLPPGLAFCTLSQKARSMIKDSKLPKYYFDFDKYIKSKENFDTPFTPAITLTIGLKESLATIKKEGIDNVINKCKEMAMLVRSAVERLGLEIFSKSPSNAVTAIKVPLTVDAALLIKAMKNKGITIAGGQGKLKGKIVRIAHMGAITKEDVKKTIDALGESLKELGFV